MIQKLLLNTQIMEDIYKIIEKHNPNKKWKLLIVFDNMIAYMLSNKKHNPIVTELIIRGRKLNISFVFITQFYFDVPKKIRLNSTHYFNMRQKATLFFQKTTSTNYIYSYFRYWLSRLCWLLILLLHQIILYVLERIL